MYSTCLFCNHKLGSNEAVESFPVGRRLAFDQRRGRLWVVCRKCEKWNLTPLEERWEAIESCERLFRDSRKSFSTGHIGLAKLSEGMELVRIGEPQRPEFAAWRYGDQFGRRRRRANLFYGSLGIVGVASFAASIYNMAGGVALFGGAVAGLNGAVQWIHIGRETYRRRRVLARIDDADGRQWLVRRRHGSFLRLVPTETGQGWGLEVPCEAGESRRRIVVEGAKARWLAAKIVPSLLAEGGSREQVQKAVRHLEEHGDPEQYLRWLARNQKQVATWRRFKDPVTGRKGTRREMDTLPWQGIEAGLAAEMAVNEENERLALEGELALLELAWKDAEEIAAIADRLTLPPSVDARFAELKQNRQ